MENLIIDCHIIKRMSDEEKVLLNYLLEEKAIYEKENNPEFSILITEKVPENSRDFSMIYVISDDFTVNEKNNLRRLESKDGIKKALQYSISDYRNRKKNVLLYLGKFPGYGFDIDGGSILARQLIHSLKIRCNLTVCFIRKNDETFSDNEVYEVKYVAYKDPWNNKFVRRLENLDTNYEALKDFNKYDIIVAGHISKFFGMNDAGNDFWRKTVIFPMFCTSSYERAGESVPEEYTEQEKIVIDNVKRIITPSNDEKKDLVNDYQCDESKIYVINRGISPLIHYKKRVVNKEGIIKLICIGTIKKQKNSKMILDLLQYLMKSEYKFEVHLVATIQDKEYYEEFCRLVENKGLTDYVKYHISISQEELAELLDEMDMNISMSSWETFGRGIFEGASAGLPTIVFDNLKTVMELSDNNKGFYFAASIEEMAKIITELADNIYKYQEMSDALSVISRKFSYKNEQNLLMQSILSLGE